MTDSLDAQLAVLKEQVAEVIRDNEKRDRIEGERRKLDDERHAAMMAQLRHLELTIASGQAFARGVRFTVGTAWAVLGGAVVWAISWIMNGGLRP